LARNDYAVIALEAMSDTAHLLRLPEFTPDFDKLGHSVECHTVPPILNLAGPGMERQREG
jgi:hypothetical protein